MVNQKVLSNLRKRFPEGCRVELTQMEDVNAPPIGTQGTVIYIDDVGTIHVNWDNGSTLGIIYETDRCRLI